MPAAKPQGTAEPGKRQAAKRNPYSNPYLLPLFSALFTFATLWKLFSQRPPLFGVSAPSACTNPTCSVHHKEILINCEDIRLFPGDSPWAVLSCDKGRRGWSPAFGDFNLKAPEGELYLWNWRDTPEEEPRPLTFKGAIGENGTTTGDFHPLGLSVIHVEGPIYRILVTNQAHRVGLVEVLDFNVETSTYEHIQTITNPRINSPNAIAALNANHFIVTSDLYFARKWSPGVIIEAALGLPLGEVLHVTLTQDQDGERNSRVQSVARIAVPSGIEVDQDSKKIWVASLTSGIYEFEYDSQPKENSEADNDPLFPRKFQAKSFLRTPFWPDNIVLSKDKKIYVSGVYSAEGFFTSMISETAPKPRSWTVELLPKILKGDLSTEQGKQEMSLRATDPANAPLRREEMRWRTIFWDDGKLYGGVSTGSVVNLGGDRSEGFIGVSLVEKGVVVCDGRTEGRGWLAEPKLKGHEEL
ncbi:hypothetical protein BDZ91DRAFT_779303 [Kalaharituber pfeilii]|nr:hypothetical protein BDZ91DRAFT_779303 [Kalaharituber pfeilii]